MAPRKKTKGAGGQKPRTLASNPSIASDRTGSEASASDRSQIQSEFELSDEELVTQFYDHKRQLGSLDQEAVEGVVGPEHMLVEMMIYSQFMEQFLDNSKHGRSLMELYVSREQRLDLSDICLSIEEAYTAKLMSYLTTQATDLCERVTNDPPSVALESEFSKLGRQILRACGSRVSHNVNIDLQEWDRYVPHCNDYGIKEILDGLHETHQSFQRALYLDHRDERIALWFLLWKSLQTTFKLLLQNSDKFPSVDYCIESSYFRTSQIRNLFEFVSDRPDFFSPEQIEGIVGYYCELIEEHYREEKPRSGHLQGLDGGKPLSSKHLQELKNFTERHAWSARALETLHAVAVRLNHLTGGPVVFRRRGTKSADWLLESLDADDNAVPGLDSHVDNSDDEVDMDISEGPSPVDFPYRHGQVVDLDDILTDDGHVDALITLEEDEMPEAVRRSLQDQSRDLETDGMTPRSRIRAGSLFRPGPIRPRTTTFGLPTPPNSSPHSSTPRKNFIKSVRLQPIRARLPMPETQSLEHLPSSERHSERDSEVDTLGIKDSIYRTSPGQSNKKNVPLPYSTAPIGVVSLDDEDIVVGSDVDVDNMKAALHQRPEPRGQNQLSVHDYIWSPYPENRSYEVANSRLICRDLQNPGIHTAGLRIQDLVNLPPPHCRTPGTYTVWKKRDPRGPYELAKLLGSIFVEKVFGKKQLQLVRPLPPPRITSRASCQHYKHKLSATRDARSRVTKPVAYPARKLVGGGGRRRRRIITSPTYGESDGSEEPGSPASHPASSDSYMSTDSPLKPPFSVTPPPPLPPVPTHRQSPTGGDGQENRTPLQPTHGQTDRRQRDHETAQVTRREPLGEFRPPQPGMSGGTGDPGPPRNVDKQHDECHPCPKYVGQIHHRCAMDQGELCLGTAVGDEDQQLIDRDALRRQRLQNLRANQVAHRADDPQAPGTHRRDYGADDMTGRPQNERGLQPGNDDMRRLHEVIQAQRTRDEPPPAEEAQNNVRRAYMQQQQRIIQLQRQAAARVAALVGEFHDTAVDIGAAADVRDNLRNTLRQAANPEEFQRLLREAETHVDQLGTGLEREYVTLGLEELQGRLDVVAEQLRAYQLVVPQVQIPENYNLLRRLVQRADDTHGALDRAAAEETDSDVLAILLVETVDLVQQLRTAWDRTENEVDTIALNRRAALQDYHRVTPEIDGLESELEAVEALNVQANDQAIADARESLRSARVILLQADSPQHLQYLLGDVLLATLREVRGELAWMLIGHYDPGELQTTARDVIQSLQNLVSRLDDNNDQLPFRARNTALVMIQNLQEYLGNGAHYQLVEALIAGRSFEAGVHFRLGQQPVQGDEAYGSAPGIEIFYANRYEDVDEDFIFRAAAVRENTIRNLLRRLGDVLELGPQLDTNITPAVAEWLVPALHARDDFQRFTQGIELDVGVQILRTADDVIETLEARWREYGYDDIEPIVVHEDPPLGGDDGEGRDRTPVQDETEDEEGPENPGIGESVHEDDEETDEERTESDPEPVGNSNEETDQESGEETDEEEASARPKSPSPPARPIRSAAPPTYPTTQQPTRRSTRAASVTAANKLAETRKQRDERAAKKDNTKANQQKKGADESDGDERGKSNRDENDDDSDDDQAGPGAAASPVPAQKGGKAKATGKTNTAKRGGGRGGNRGGQGGRGRKRAAPENDDNDDDYEADKETSPKATGTGRGRSRAASSSDAPPPAKKSKISPPAKAPTKDKKDDKKKKQEPAKKPKSDDAPKAPPKKKRDDSDDSGGSYAPPPSAAPAATGGRVTRSAVKAAGKTAATAAKDTAAGTKTKGKAAGTQKAKNNTVIGSKVTKPTKTLPRVGEKEKAGTPRVVALVATTGNSFRRYMAMRSNS